MSPIIAVVTGASRGIGYQIVKKFLELNDIHVVALSRDLSAMEKLREEVANPLNLSINYFDITSYRKENLKDIFGEFAHVDILINNAAILTKEVFLETTLEDWRKVFETNVFGPARLIKDILPKMKKGHKKHIVNIGSMAGYQGSRKFAGLSAYSASKAALANLSESLAVEFKDDGISVSCLCLGSVETKMFRTAFPDYSASYKSEEMAEIICDFALNKGGDMNGEVVPVDLKGL